MAKRLATAVQDNLQRVGIDVLPSLGGTDAFALIDLIDPAHMVQARKTLRTAGYNFRQAGHTSLQVTLAAKAKNKDSDDESEFLEMIASWKEFAKRSSDAGFKKANSILNNPGPNLVSAAAQVADQTAHLAKTSPKLRKIALLLKKAAKKGDTKTINKLFAALGSGVSKPKPTFKNPVKDKPAQIQPPEKVQSSGEKERQAKRKADARTDSAIRFILNHAATNGMNSKQILSLLAMGGKPYEVWKQNQPGLTENTAAQIWSVAVQMASEQMAQEEDRANPTTKGSDGGIDTILPTASSSRLNEGFSVSSALDVPKTQKQIIKCVEQMMEHYAHETHPEDLSDEQIKSFLDDNAPDISYKDAVKVLNKLTGKGIPKRHEDE